MKYLFRLKDVNVMIDGVPASVGELTGECELSLEEAESIIRVMKSMGISGWVAKFLAQFEF